MNPYSVTVERIEDHPDGSCTISFEMGAEAMKIFAAIGLQQAIMDKAKEILNGHPDTKGAGDAGAGEDDDPPVHGEFPGF